MPIRAVPARAAAASGRILPRPSSHDIDYDAKMGIWQRLCGLRIEIEGYELSGHASDWRLTSVVRLFGGGSEGFGEDPNYDPADQLAFQEAGPTLPLSGRYTLGELSDLLETLPVFPTTPGYAGSEDYRRWAFESAALDLALRQVGISLAQCLELTPEPLTFVSSLHLDTPAKMPRIRELLAAQPGVQLKLDATAAWTDELITELAATGAVRVVDFKGAYHGTPVDQEADAALYRRVIEGLPTDVLIEDPHADPVIDSLLAPHLDRVTWDAPIHSIDDIRALPHQPRVINFKPSRFGTLKRLFDAYDFCHDQKIDIYGGGQFELGVGRHQVQYLAALFHPDAPNDVAPSEYNTADSFGELPGSPLRLRPSATGFRLD